MNHPNHYNRHQQDDARKRDENPSWLQRRTAAEVETFIRAREVKTIRELIEKPWLAGRYLAQTVATCRRLHSESIRRERLDRRS